MHLVVPQIHPFDFGEESINSGDSITVVCSIMKGDLPITFEWLHNGNTIGESDEITINRAGKKGSTLIIDNIQDIHAGQYTCKATNSAGFATHAADLHVNGIV